MCQRLYVKTNFLIVVTGKSVDSPEKRIMTTCRQMSQKCRKCLLDTNSTFWSLLLSGNPVQCMPVTSIEVLIFSIAIPTALYRPHFGPEVANLAQADCSQF